MGGVRRKKKRKLGHGKSCDSGVSEVAVDGLERTRIGSQARLFGVLSRVLARGGGEKTPGALPFHLWDFVHTPWYGVVLCVVKLWICSILTTTPQK